MSEQHQVWSSEVRDKLNEKGWSNADLAQVVGVSRATISELFRYGKGSDDLKLRVSRKLGITTSWE